MRVALDTNVLVYAEGLDGSRRRAVALDLLERLPQSETVIPVQALGELFNVLVRKAGKPRQEARDIVLGWLNSFDTKETSIEVMVAATDVARDHQFPIWGAVILAAASQASCRVLLSEDLPSGFTWGGVTIVNPFASPRHSLLEALFAGS